jgi:hypothetical protein
MTTFRSLLLALALLAAPVAAFADGLQVEPGLWEFSSSLPDQLGGEAAGGVYRTCIRDRSVTPERVMAERKECRITNAVFTGPSARWRMRCETPAGPMNGSGAVRSTGSAVAGSLEMTMAVGGFEVPVSGGFRGRRVGACR